MARTSGTRVGNGAGYGGPKRGEGNQDAGPGRPEGLKTGEGKKLKAREALEAAAPMAIQTVIDIASDKSDQRALAAALGILNRIGLHEKSGVEVTGEGGGPMVIRRIIVDPKLP